MAAPSKDDVGSVCLVGAGPGDPGLITVRGLACLRRADVVVYDALSHPRLLLEAPDTAELVDAGKRARCHRLSQDAINALLLERARAGAYVVRLKGGDPYLFGRGAEEVEFLGKHGVTCEVVSGVTAGIAAATCGGVPVTHRQHASSVTFVTGHEDPTKGQSSLDYHALAALVRSGGTLCIYMGIGRLKAILKALCDEGAAATTSVAVVQHGTLPSQRTVCFRLGDGTEPMEAAGIGAPAIVVVGPVAGVDAPALQWYANRPLFGRRVVITRTRHQASRLREALEALGAEVLEAPTIRIRPPANPEALDALVRDLGRFDWLLLTSANAVTALAGRMRDLGVDARSLAGVRVGAIGTATAAALDEHLALRADLVPGQFTGDALARALLEGQTMRGRRVLWLRADIARPAVAQILTEAGAEVTTADAYRSESESQLPNEVLTALRAGSVDWVTFTSAATVRNLVALLGEEKPLLQRARLASIGPITSEAFLEQSLTVDVEACPHNIDGLVTAILAAEST